MQVDLYSEKDILEGCKNNKRQYQEILYRKYATKMYGICMSYSGDRDMAQDILQESFIKVFKKIKGFNMEGSLEGWIRRIVSNTAIDSLRKRQREYSYINDSYDDPVEDFKPGVLEEMKATDIMNMVSRLPEGARLIFNLFALEGYSHSEIAKKLNITEGTSKSQFSRARKMLMSLVNKYSA